MSSPRLNKEFRYPEEQPPGDDPASSPPPPFPGMHWETVVVPLPALTPVSSPTDWEMTTFDASPSTTSPSTGSGSASPTTRSPTGGDSTPG